MHGECLSGECVERYGGKACLFETGGGIKRTFHCEGDGRNSSLRMYLRGSIAVVSFLSDAQSRHSGRESAAGEGKRAAGGNVVLPLRFSP